ncbi:MAG: hypothetical protein JO147_14165, partial [Actinobacteria bacterium]|nr:hypothetical protein [Actinomycetota bacterium]
MVNAIVVGSLLSLAPVSAAVVSGSTLAGGQALGSGQSITSPNGQYRFTMQSNGDAVETGPSGPLFDSGTSGASNFLAMQSDGNLVVYSASGAPLWSAETAGHANALLTIDDSGALALTSRSTRIWLATNNVLRGGSTLTNGQALHSPSDTYSLKMQSDGNLVLYGPTRAIWATATTGHAGDFLVLQADGNLVLYAANFSVLFAAGTHGRPDIALTLNDDSSLVLTSKGALVWLDPAPSVTAGSVIPPGETVRSADARFGLAMQRDGNLVLYGPGGVYWSSDTAGQPGAYAAVQRDGNFVVYSASGQPLFYSDTAGHDAALLTVQLDGNLVLYAGSGAPVWSSISGDQATSLAVTSAAQLAAARGEQGAVAVYDRLTRRYYVAGNADSFFASASVMKTFIATKLLVSGQAKDPNVAALMWRMITLSDDNAADTLYGIVGGAGVATWVAQRYGIVGIAA